MKERSIIFSGEMVKAILDGRKSQTRRIICGVDNADHFVKFYDRGAIFTDTILDHLTGKDNDHQIGIRFKYGQVGDRLWVRETWCPVNDEQFGGEKWIDYRATPRYEASRPAGWENAPDDIAALKWRSPIFMPRWASRITLEITGVRVERVQDISHGDMLAEGLIDTGFLSTDCAHLWDSINAKRGFGWDANPWVFVIEFKKVNQ